MKVIRQWKKRNVIEILSCCFCCFPFPTILPCAPLIYTLTIIKQWFFSPFPISLRTVNLGEIAFFSPFQAIHQGYTGTNPRTRPFSRFYSVFPQTCTKRGRTYVWLKAPFCFTHEPTNIILICCSTHVLFLAVGLSWGFTQLLQSQRRTKPQPASAS